MTPTAFALSVTLVSHVMPVLFAARVLPRTTSEIRDVLEVDDQQRAVLQLGMRRDERRRPVAGTVVAAARDEHQGVLRLRLLREVARQPDEHGEPARVVVAALKVAVGMRVDDDPLLPTARESSRRRSPT